MEEASIINFIFDLPPDKVVGVIILLVVSVWFGHYIGYGKGKLAGEIEERRRKDIEE